MKMKEEKLAWTKRWEKKSIWRGCVLFFKLKIVVVKFLHTNRSSRKKELLSDSKNSEKFI